MDLDGLFVSALLNEGPDALRVAMERGIDVTYLKGDGLKVFEFIKDHVGKYQDYPTADIIGGATGLTIPPPAGAPALFFIDQVINRRLHKAIGDSLAKVMEHYEAMEPIKAYEAYEDGLRDIRKNQLSPTRSVSVTSMIPEFLEFYDLLEGGHRGILTPWDTVNDATLGFWPEDLILYVARLGVGKTYMLIILADYAWSVLGKRVLFCTTEMSRLAVIQRWVAVHYRYPAAEIKKAQLGAFAKQQMIDGLTELKEKEGFYIVGGDFDFRIDSLDAAIEEREPDLVLMDGAYLIKSAGKSRIERASNSYDELKRCAARNHVPLVATTQFNREVKPNKAGSVAAEKIALSDAAGWNASLIYGLVRTDDMARDKRMLQLALKVREGEKHEFETWWDLDEMNFEELPKGPQAALVAPTSGKGGAVDPNQPPPPQEPDTYGAGLFDGGSGDDEPDPNDPERYLF